MDRRTRSGDRWPSTDRNERSGTSWPSTNKLRKRHSPPASADQLPLPADSWPSEDRAPLPDNLWSPSDRAALSNDSRSSDDQLAADDQWSQSADPWSPADSQRSNVADLPVRVERRGGKHRMPAPPAALRGRAAIVAVAAGALVAAGQNLVTSTDKAPVETVAPMALGQAQAMPQEPAATEPGLLDEGPADLGQFSDILSNGSKVAEEMTAEAEAKLRPLFMKFTTGTFTSGYGMRWGALHPGVDIAAPIGTPIVAVEDGTVISSGPAAGFGMWVRLLGDDGTVTVYGHINTSLVTIGQHVMAGDEIATVGNRGETTGPHCHFEVWLNGTNRIDPLPWLATRGISLGQERD
ncbi:M23 family metallopeptidase [Nocardia colli]|uniref:M23 family metallopeptidase n=1 Tax=Nocardia colli TaxID=2545717 RepID=A0A5N0DKZ3_9NOCA|nr:M23 family metallopeptidase [Nocardia colli]